MTQPTIQRGQVAPVALPTEAVDVPPIGGIVLVRGLDMPQTMAFSAARRRATQPVGTEDQAQAAERAAGELVPLLLSMSVVLDDGLPVYSLAEWQAFGGRHPGDMLRLWERAIALSGQNPEAEKKT